MAARLLGEAAQVLRTHRFRGSHGVQELTTTDSDCGVAPAAAMRPLARGKSPRRRPTPRGTRTMADGLEVPRGMPT